MTPGVVVVAGEMRGDRVGDYGAMGGPCGLLAVALFFYVILGGPFRRNKGGGGGGGSNDRSSGSRR